MKSKLLMGFAVVLLTACTALGVPIPQSFNEKSAVAISTVTSIRNTAGSLLISRKISAADAQNIQDQADNARAGIEIAIQIHATDPGTAENRLTAVLVGLNAISEYLAAKGK